MPAFGRYGSSQSIAVHPADIPKMIKIYMTGFYMPKAISLHPSLKDAHKKRAASQPWTILTTRAWPCLTRNRFQ